MHAAEKGIELEQQLHPRKQRAPDALQLSSRGELRVLRFADSEYTLLCYSANNRVSLVQFSESERGRNKLDATRISFTVPSLCHDLALFADGSILLLNGFANGTILLQDPLRKSFVPLQFNKDGSMFACAVRTLRFVPNSQHLFVVTHTHTHSLTRSRNA
jgi:hypothetical protein